MMARFTPALIAAAFAGALATGGTAHAVEKVAVGTGGSASDAPF